MSFLFRKQNERERERETDRDLILCNNRKIGLHFQGFFFLIFYKGLININYTQKTLNVIKRKKLKNFAIFYKTVNYNLLLLLLLLLLKTLYWLLIITNSIYCC